MYTFAFDHGVSDGQHGYGAVQVTTPDGDVFYIGRAFARTVLPERFPEVGMTYDEAVALIAYLSAEPSYRRKVDRCLADDHYWSEPERDDAHETALVKTCVKCGLRRRIT